ncbi:ATP-binding cassette sub-family A member 2 [Macrochelys suwanniensis]
MGFLHQLHLLLWKNVTLKRRSPWVLAFEIFIPLVLFFILLGLRQKKPTIPVKEGECGPWGRCRDALEGNALLSRGGRVGEKWGGWR